MRKLILVCVTLVASAFLTQTGLAAGKSSAGSSSHGNAYGNSAGGMPSGNMGGGMAGGVSADHMSASGALNNNAQFNPDAVRGLDRAAERMGMDEGGTENEDSAEKEKTTK